MSYMAQQQRGKQQVNKHSAAYPPPPGALARATPVSEAQSGGCFRFWNCGIWRFHFLVVYEDHIFPVV